MRQSATERMFRVGTIYYTNKSNKKKKKKKPACKSSLTHHITTLGSQDTTNTTTCQVTSINAIYLFQNSFSLTQTTFIRLLCLSWASIELRASPLPLIIPSSSSELLPEQPTITTTTTTRALLLTYFTAAPKLAQSGGKRERERERENEQRTIWVVHGGVLDNQDKIH